MKDGIIAFIFDYVCHWVLWASGGNDFSARSVYGSVLPLTHFSIQTKTKVMVVASP